MGFSPTFDTRVFQRGERKALWCARRRNPPFSNEGMTRRLRRGRWGCRPAGGSTFFRSERKYQRKHAARRLREKALYCPFLKEGVRNVARKLVGELTQAIVRARAHSFPLSKRARLFPFAAYRRSAPPQLARGHTQPLQGGCFGVACVFSQGKRPAGNQIHADLYCKPEGLSPDGGLSYPTSTKPHQTREPRGLLPSGGKPAIKLLSSERSARIARSPGSRGTAPCASREACCRAAVNLRSSCFPPSALRA